MARRRQAAVPEPGRLWRFAAHAIAVVALLVATGALVWGGKRLLDPATMPIAAVQVRGTFAHVERDALRTIVERYAAAGFLRLEVEALRNELEQLPWVYRVAVRRRWPDGLMVEVDEQRPAAVWAAGGLINESGERFAAEVQAAHAGLPLLEGPEGSVAEVAQRYVEVQRMLRALGTRVVALRMSERRAWRAQLENGIELKLGRSDIDRRLLRFVRTYGEAIAPKLADIEVVDLRYTNGFAVRWKATDTPTA